MKKFIVMAALLMGLAFQAKAQEPYTCHDGGPCWTPAKFEVALMPGFTFDNTPVSTTFGVVGDAAYFPFQHPSSPVQTKPTLGGLGLATDFAYSTWDYGKGNKENLFTAMVGPRYRYVLGDGWSVFGQGLVGVTHETLGQAVKLGANTTIPQSATLIITTRGSWLVGGGLDAQFSQHFSIRFIEYAYEDTIFHWQSHQRISAGLKFSF